MELQMPVMLERRLQEIDRGFQITDAEFKRALHACEPDLVFDMGDRFDLWHPRKGQWQAVHYRGKHLTSMERGTIPEWNIYFRGMVLRLGWRETLETIANRVPKVTREKVCAFLGAPLRRPVYKERQRITLPSAEADV